MRKMVNRSCVFYHKKKERKETSNLVFKICILPNHTTSTPDLMAGSLFIRPME